jgi:geranylgeranyl pyrophosphate synthase
MSWILPVGCGLEMMHAFSLVHDDLPCMDDDDYRRGRPSLHRRFGAALAILAADALLVEGFRLLARGPAPVGRRVAVIASVAQAIGAGGMTGGQARDLLPGRPGSTRERPPARARLVMLTHRLKTAELIAAALVAGAVIAGRGHEVGSGLHKAGLELGLLFQLTDDLLDYSSSRERGGMVKAVGAPATRALAARTAARAEHLFAELGPKYHLLAAIPGLVLDRTE